VGAAGDAVRVFITIGFGVWVCRSRIGAVRDPPGERGIANSPHNPETLPRSLDKRLRILQLERKSHRAHDRRSELEHFLDVDLVDGPELRRLIGPEIHPAEEGIWRLPGIPKRVISLSSGILLSYPIALLSITVLKVPLGYSLPRNNRPVPIHRLVPVPLALRDIIANDLVAPRAVTEAFAGVFPF